MTRLQPWLRWAWIAMIPIAISFWWAKDKPPAIIGKTPISVIESPPGGVARINLPVDREVSIERKCSMTLVRSLTDSRGDVHKLETQRFTHFELLARYKESPNTIMVNIDIPVYASLGAAIYKSKVEYLCWLGFLPYLYDIDVELPLRILDEASL